MTNGLQNRCSTTELSRRREEGAKRLFPSSQLYRSARLQSTDGWEATFTTTQGTGPPPPGLQRGRPDAGTAEAAVGAVLETRAGAVTAAEVDDAVRGGDGEVGDG